MPELVRAKWVSALVFPAVNQDPQATFEWLLQFQSQPRLSNWIRQVAGVQARQDPDAALAMVGNLNDPEVYENSLPGIIINWISWDAISATGWLENNSGGDRRLDLFNFAAGSWYRKEPSLAEAWVLGLSDDLKRDCGLIGILSQLEPQSLNAKRLRNEIRTDDAISRAMSMVSAHLIKTDYKAAQIMLDESDISVQYRQELQEIIDEEKRLNPWQD